jgi:hypothetical protein
LIARLRQQGRSADAIFSEVVQVNRNARVSLPWNELHDLLKGELSARPTPSAAKLPPGTSEDVNQESQSTRTNQELPKKTTEPLREPASAVRPHVPRSSKEIFRHELANGCPSSLSLEAYLIHVVEEQRGHESETWQSPLFYFIRILKAHPALSEATAKQAFQKVETIMKTWRHAIPKKPPSRPDDWLHWLEVTRDDAEAEFLGVWDKVRYLPGFSPLDNALEHAQRYPLQLAKENADRRPEGYQRFISIAGWLQVGMGDQNILLPVEDLGEILGVEPMTVTRYRRWAKEDGFLQEIKPYEFKGRMKSGRATEFRFDVSRFPILRERAQGSSEK